MLLDISLKEMLAEAVTMLSAAALAGISAYACIHVFIRLVERTGMRPYVYYRIAWGSRSFLSSRGPTDLRSERNVVFEIGVI